MMSQCQKTGLGNLKKAMREEMFTIICEHIYERVGEGYAGFVLATPIFYFRFLDNMGSRL